MREAIKAAAESIRDSHPAYYDAYASSSEYVREHSHRAAEKATRAYMNNLWQPIETVQKGEMFIYAKLKWDGTFGIGLAYWSVSGLPMADNGHAVVSRANGYTHWMPLPPAPSSVNPQKEAILAADKFRKMLG